jgi:murein DD-endopeptidase MepM/ murein hydrolase activator NlpD
MGFSTLYGHLSKLLVSEGDKVSAGDLIAIAGNTGRSSGPHLHYEIRLNDTSVDPFKYLDTEAPTAEGL